MKIKIKQFYFRFEKEILLIVLILDFAIPFTLINAWSIGRPAHDLRIYWDFIMPHWPIFIPIYLSAFLIPLVPYFLVKDIKLFRLGALAFLFTHWAAFITYLLFPAMITRPVLPESSFWVQIFHYFHKIDPPYNSFPSLHVVQPTLAAIMCFLSDKKNWWVFVWTGLIIISVLFTGQHVIADVFAGLLLAFVAYILILRKK